MNHSRRTILSISGNFERQRLRKLLLALGLEVEMVSPRWLKSRLISKDKFEYLICDKISFNPETQRILSKYQPSLVRNIILATNDFEKGSEIDSAVEYLRVGVFVAIDIRKSDNEIFKVLEMTFQESQKLRSFNIALLNKKSQFKDKEFLQKLGHLDLFRELTQLWLLQKSANESYINGRQAYKIANDLFKKFPSSKIIGHFLTSKMYETGQVEEAYFSSKQLFTSHQKPIYFDLAFRICQQDHLEKGNKKLGENFLVSFSESQRTSINPYYKTLISWYCENLKVWRDLKFLNNQNLNESLLHKEILPSLIPFLERMTSLVVRKSKNHWIKQQLLPVLRKGLDLAIYLDPTHEVILDLILKVDQEFQTKEGLVAFSYARGLRIKKPEFYVVYAKYCMYLNDIREASLAIRKAQILSAGVDEVKLLKNEWSKRYLEQMAS